MKRLLFIPLVVMAFLACKQTDNKQPDPEAELQKKEALQQELADTVNLTDIQWLDSADQQLGTLTPNKTINIVWRFKNVGNKPLVIDNATASCGCTVPEKPEKPIAPGEESLIKATFNGSGSGTILKQVHVYGNLKPNREKTLSFTGQIEDK